MQALGTRELAAVVAATASGWIVTPMRHGQDLDRQLLRTRLWMRSVGLETPSVDVVASALAGSPPVPFRAPPGVALVRLQLDNGQTILEAFRPGTENSARPPVDPLASAPGAAAASVDTGLGGLY